MDMILLKNMREQIRNIVSLDKKTIKKLNEIKKEYQKLISSLSKIEYSVIEKATTGSLSICLSASSLNHLLNSSLFTFFHIFISSYVDAVSLWPSIPIKIAD